ncbi:pilin [Photobacterium damselae]
MKGQKGFTLIELMIVVAIIGVLSALAIPAYQNYVQKTEVASAVGTLRGLLTNIDMYQQEHGGTFPSALSEAGGSVNMNNMGEITITEADQKIEFKFTKGSLAESGSEGTISYTKSSSGWICEPNNIPAESQANSCTE